MKRTVTSVCCTLLLLLGGPSLQAAGESYSFGVNPQRNAALTAQYWNPILSYVTRKSGVKLEMKVEKSGQDYSLKVGQGLYDFAYTNHIFNPANAKAGYRVFACPDGDAIRGEIVVTEDSPVHTLEDLAGREVGFPSRAAFVAYVVPLDALTRRGVVVKPVFGGNQEGIMAQLKGGKVVAAGVNSQILRAFAQREKMKYRVVWQSQEFRNLPLVAHPRLPARIVAAVRKALTEMNGDPEGRKILQTSAALVGQTPPFLFKASSDKDDRNQWDFYKTTVVPEFRE